MPSAPVPGVEKVGKAVVNETGDRPHQRMAENGGEPALTRGQPPDCDRNVGADEQAAGCVGGVQPATHGVDRNAVSCERLGLQIDVVERDLARLDGGDQLGALAADAGIANRQRVLYQITRRGMAVLSPSLWKAVANYIE